MIMVRVKKSRQPLRDSEAALRGPVCFYLRTFYSDRKILLPNPYSSIWYGLYTTESMWLGAEEFVARVMEPYFHVRELGGGATIGTSRIAADEQHWQETVKSVCQTAVLIVILPILGKNAQKQITGMATLWELRHLTESGLLPKTLAISLLLLS
jgi:hypothetical protein